MLKSMAGTETRKNNEWRLNEQLRRLFIKKSFKRAISDHRARLGIPKGGFISNEEFKKWLGRDLEKFDNIRQACIDVVKKFNLPFIRTNDIEARLAMGSKYKQYDFKLPWDGYTRGFEQSEYLCAWETDPGYECAVIKIAAGATAKDVKRYIDRNFSEIKKFLNTFKNRAIPTRSNKKLKRNRQILKFRKKGVINALGCITIPEKDRDSVLPKEINNMDPDTIRSVLKKEKRIKR